MCFQGRAFSLSCFWAFTSASPAASKDEHPPSEKARSRLPVSNQRESSRGNNSLRDICKGKFCPEWKGKEGSAGRASSCTAPRAMSRSNGLAWWADPSQPSQPGEKAFLEQFPFILNSLSFFLSWALSRVWAELRCLHLHRHGPCRVRWERAPIWSTHPGASQHTPEAAQELPECSPLLPAQHLGLHLPVPAKIEEEDRPGLHWSLPCTERSPGVWGRPRDQ